jgi:hypothetical protein
MIYKRGKFQWYKFIWQGSLVRESTKQSNDKVARNMYCEEIDAVGTKDDLGAAGKNRR